MRTITITKRDRKQLERRRLAAGRLFTSGVTQYRVAKRFGVSTSATNQWYKAWKKKKELKQLIINGPLVAGYPTNFWTVDRIRAITKKKLKKSPYPPIRSTG